VFFLLRLSVSSQGRWIKTIERVRLPTNPIANRIEAGMDRDSLRERTKNVERHKA
jgi:hypothetical protein